MGSGVEPALGTALRSTAKMADLMWGGVPFTIPSKTAMKYLSGAVKVKRECNLPEGGHYNSRQTMERELRGHRESRREMLESYENFDRQQRRMRSEPRQSTKSEVRVPRLTTVQRLRAIKPWSGIGWTEPRREATMGMVDIRKTLHGYVRGIKMRDSLLNN